MRDLARDPVSHLDAARFAAFLTEKEKRTAEQQAVVDYSDALIGELKRADVVVLGLPMYNFGVPSALKAYFDHMARAGVTFRYTEKGAVGMLTGKSVYVFTARGGFYAGTPSDTQTPYVRDFFAFLGMDEIEFVHGEGLAISAASKQQGLTRAARRARLARARWHPPNSLAYPCQQCSRGRMAAAFRPAAAKLQLKPSIPE